MEQSVSVTLRSPRWDRRRYRTMNIEVDFAGDHAADLEFVRSIFGGTYADATVAAVQHSARTLSI